MYLGIMDIQNASPKLISKSSETFRLDVISTAYSHYVDLYVFERNLPAG